MQVHSFNEQSFLLLDDMTSTLTIEYVGTLT